MKPIIVATALALAAAVAPAFAQKGESRAVGKELTQRETAFHVLNRLAFGPRPGETDLLLKKGWMRWVLEQLEPGKIDDPIEKRIRKECPSLFLSLPGILDVYRPRDLEPGLAAQRKRNQLRRQCMLELTNSVLLRAVYSTCQLREVMVEFWRNHFNVDQTKNQVAFLANHYEAEVIRAHVFGRFEELLMASARHPAMLVYLDNALSQKPPTEIERKMLEKARQNPKRRQSGFLRRLARQRGLNENYARELMELHTLGVDNHYRQSDVVEVARALTGWSVVYGDDLRFVFRRAVHDYGPKRILGQHFPGRGAPEGLAEGEYVVRMLARHPGTARFISWKLCRYLVNDRPPKQLVDRVARVFRKSRGDLKQVYLAAIMSPEFLGRASFRTKFKTPFEFTVSALRATGARVVNPLPVLRMLKVMGMPLYQMDDPTGYYDQAEAWLDPGVLVHRWRFALALGAGRLPGVRIPPSFYGTIVALPPARMKQEIIRMILPGAVGSRIDAVLDDAIARTSGRSRLGARLLGMILGSPAFQQQ